MAHRVLVVDDSAFMRGQLPRLIEEQSDFEVVGTAAHGVAALAAAESFRPELITLDVQMPVMNGLSTLKRIMTRRPVATVMVSSLTSHDSHITFECLRYGAVDFVQKPSTNRGIVLSDVRNTLVDRLRRASRVVLPTPTLRMSGSRRIPLEEGAVPDRTLAVTSGQSGIAGIIKLLLTIPPTYTGSVIVCLEAPGDVVESLAQYLAKRAVIPVERATVNPLRAGTAYIVSAADGLTVIGPRNCPVFGESDVPNVAIAGYLAERLTTSVVDVFRDDASLLLLSGSCEGALEGAERFVELGGGLFVQSPEGALDPAMLNFVVDERLPATVRDLDELIKSLVSTTPDDAKAQVREGVSVRR